jgi:hypothetical protein
VGHALLLEIGLSLDPGPTLGLLDAHALLAVAPVDLVAPAALRLLDRHPARFVFLADAALGLLGHPAALIVGPTPGRFLLRDALLLDAAQLAQGEEDRAFFPFSHGADLVLG